MSKGDNKRKLNYEIAKAIRIAYITDPEVTQKQLAKKYNISITTVANIINNKHYKEEK